MDEDCPHGMGMAAACVLCNGRAHREEREAKLASAERRKVPFWLFKRQRDDRWIQLGSAGRPLDRVVNREFAPDWRDVKFAKKAVVK